uniref:Mobile element protein n=1 Tax=uncultured Thiotrichaceae bacterium TaxID=298394 RepID=A0A6S6UD82_9GAMM|nr:MAG: Mobile element protein [uncultured Thiotrichaceae bacterium]
MRESNEILRKASAYFAHKVVGWAWHGQQLITDIQRVWNDLWARKVWLQLNNEAIDVARCRVKCLLQLNRVSPRSINLQTPTQPAQRFSLVN